MITLLLALLASLIPIPAHLLTDLVENTGAAGREGAVVRSAHPSLSWAIESEEPNISQLASRVLVASSPDLLKEGSADIWDSGKVRGSGRLGVVCGGTALEPGREYWWTVNVRTRKGWSGYSAPAHFRTADVLDGGPAYYPLSRTYVHPESVSVLPDGRVFLDFGKAAFGQFSFKAGSCRPGEVTVHFGEAAKDGAVDRNPGGSIRYCSLKARVEPSVETSVIFPHDKRNTDPSANESGVVPILMPEETGEVYPFRYVEIEGLDQRNVSAGDFVRAEVHYPFDDGASSFHSSDETLNAVWDLCKYSIKATSFCGIYVDGDRERIPYEADAYINQLGHYSVDREFSMARRSVDHLMANPTWPTEWILESVLLCWYDYMYTGDKGLLEKWYDLIKRRTLLSLKQDNGLISTRVKPLDKEFYGTIGFRGKNMRDIVDWPQKGAAGLGKQAAGEADGFVLTNYNAAVNALWCHTLAVAADIAGVLGHREDESYLRREAEDARNALNTLLFDPEAGCYRDGTDTPHHSLHGNMYALAFGLVPGDKAASVASFVKSRGMACSVYGAQFLLDALYAAGEADHASSLMNSRSIRSWYNMLALGSTITLEAWDPAFKPNLDWNHAWGAAPANIIPRGLMGLEPLEPGFTKMRIHPQPGLIEKAEAVIPTISGPVGIAYDTAGGFNLEVDIPAGTTAEVWLPKKSGGWRKVSVGSGHHSFYSAN